MSKEIARKACRMYEGLRLLQTTWKPHVFWSRMRKVEALAEELQAHEEQLAFRRRPSEILKELRENRETYEQQFAERYMAAVEARVAAIRTENGQEKARERAVERFEETMKRWGDS